MLEQTQITAAIVIAGGLQHDKLTGMEQGCTAWPSCCPVVVGIALARLLSNNWPLPEPGGRKVSN